MKLRKANEFVSNVCKKLRWEKRWMTVDSVGRSGGLLVGWSDIVTIHSIQACEFCEGPETNRRMWAIFVYASIRDRIRAIQWQELVIRSSKKGG